VTVLLLRALFSATDEPTCRFSSVLSVFTKKIVFKFL